MVSPPSRSASVADGLARFARDELGQLVATGGDAGADPAQRVGALVGRQRAHALEATHCGLGRLLVLLLGGEEGPPGQGARVCRILDIEQER
jgi:hypothetical protein